MHAKKRMTFHGVDYIMVPAELWEDAKAASQFIDVELHQNMLAYEGSEEPVELKDE